ncbi:tetratricopeptide repeat protein [Kordia sp. SMS9]|uniref:AraC family transcriptional regulator n=1 Tax=Kordia sp. SMS9 TaxID=2282170 RepID=UPI000E0D3006|nr:AraC family transcriptional regulator [Kordia sp. SMS9]AXG71168.1 tetratricopeptide repeat protein [Kordia sp. SMS9]
MKQLLVILCCLFINNSQAQSNKAFEKAEKLYSQHIYKKNSFALKFALQAKNAAMINDDAQQLTRAFYYVANSLCKLDKNMEALQNIESAISYSATTKDIELLQKCFSLKGDIHSELGDNSKALKAYLKALTYSEAIANPDYEIYVLCNIAFIKKVHKDFEEAIQMYKRVLKRLDASNNSTSKKVYKLIALMNIADAYLWTKNTEEAAVFNDEGLQDCCDNSTEWLRNPLLMNKAIIYYQRNQYDNCIAIAKQIRDATEKDKKRALYLTSLFYLGKSAYKLENYSQAIQYLEQTLQIVNTSDTVDVNEKELHEFLALLYNKTGNSEKNLFHFQQYAALEKKESAADLKINNETHKLIDIVSVRNEIDEIKDDLAAQTINKKRIFFAAIVLFVLLIGSVVYYKRREKILKNKFEGVLQKVAKLEKEEEAPKTIPKKEKVTDEKATAILRRIADFEKKEYYLLLECSLGFMAEKLRTNTSYLSKVINTYKKKSFTSYITELRIDTALVRLKNDKTLQSYTIKAIAEEFGFKRQETFSKAFKSHTGIYPSQYLKKLRK